MRCNACVCLQYETELAMTSAYSSMDAGVVSSLSQYDMHSAAAAAAAAGRSMMLHSPPPHFTQQPPPPAPAPPPPAGSHRQSPSTPLNSAAAYHSAAAAQLTGYGAPGPAGGAAGYGVAAASTPGVSPGAAGTPSTDAPAKRDRDSIYGFVVVLHDRFGPTFGFGQTENNVGLIHLGSTETESK